MLFVNLKIVFHKTYGQYYDQLLMEISTLYSLSYAKSSWGGGGVSGSRRTVAVVQMLRDLRVPPAAEHTGDTGHRQQLGATVHVLLPRRLQPMLQ